MQHPEAHGPLQAYGFASADAEVSGAEAASPASVAASTVTPGPQAASATKSGASLSSIE